ncbi:MAG: enoyl-CoA hydratase/isomerase family protein [Sphingomonadaceae bacterium]
MSQLLATVEGNVGVIRLNRPEAIHALTRDMCAAMIAALQQWAADPAVELVLIDHAAGRGFCAGGDIRMLAESAAGDGTAARDFFRIEYQLNHLMFTYPKPIAAFVDGITMGGGVGISQPASFRIATENTRFAMPETGIGLFIDVGGGWYLSRLPGRIGQFLALTGHRLNGAECLALGLATHYVPADRLTELKAQLLADPQRIAAILDDFSAPAPPAPILVDKPQIDRLFRADRLEEIYADLAADGGEWADKQRAVLDTKSPVSMKVCLRLLEKSLALTAFEEEMALEYAIASRIIRHPDFIEGVRALIVDKDNQPRWAVGQVSDAEVDEIVAPLPSETAWTPAKERA